MIKLWHCHNSRSLRVLWALEELGVNYQLVSMPFPPRFLEKSFLDVNPLGTVPFMQDGITSFTESSAMLMYLGQKYPTKGLALEIDDKQYGKYLNWLFQSDATLTFPQTLLLRYSQFEQADRQQQQVVDDYTTWFLSRLKSVNEALLNADYLCAEQFTMADIAVGYALYLGHLLGLSEFYKPQTLSYLNRLMQRPAFIKVKDIGKEVANYQIKPLIKCG